MTLQTLYYLKKIQASTAFLHVFTHVHVIVIVLVNVGVGVLLHDMCVYDKERNRERDNTIGSYSLCIILRPFYYLLIIYY